MFYSLYIIPSSPDESTFHSLYITSYASEETQVHRFPKQATSRFKEPRHFLNLPVIINAMNKMQSKSQLCAHKRCKCITKQNRKRIRFHSSPTSQLNDSPR